MIARLDTTAPSALHMEMPSNAPQERIPIELLFNLLMIALHVHQDFIVREENLHSVELVPQDTTARRRQAFRILILVLREHTQMKLICSMYLNV